MRVVVERAGNENIEVGVAGFTRGRNQIGTGDGAKLGADEDGRPLLGSILLGIPAFGTDAVAGPRSDRRESNLVFLVRLLHAAGLQRIENHLDKVLRVSRVNIRGSRCLEEVFILIHSKNTMRRKALDSERTSDADLLVVLVGLVVKRFEISLGSDGG